MPDGAKTLLTILLIPFLLAAGHDIYINYFSDPETIENIKNLQIQDIADDVVNAELPPNRFLISDMGWVWNEYAPNMMSAAREMVSADKWSSMINPILKLPTMIVGLIPWLITFAYLIFARLAGFWPCANNPFSFRFNKKTKTEKKFKVYETEKVKKKKYKR